MQVLVTYGAGPESTAALARAVAEALEDAGLRAVALPCGEGGRVLAAFDAVVVGGRLEGGRWPLGLRWFVWRRAAQLRQMPVWFFSDDPSSASADGGRAAPSAAIGALMGRAGARGHAAFPGRPRSRPGQSPPAGEDAGRWRSRDRIQAWAFDLALELRNGSKAADLSLSP
ncbi:MAG TPA: hypothetical protein VGK67_03715 [Myxococcales bacterium]|jgi:hypothetical protein